MIQLIPLICLLVVMVILTGKLFYGLGYDERERKFQNDNIQWNKGGKPALLIAKTKDGKLEIEIYNKEIVKIKK